MSKTPILVLVIIALGVNFLLVPVAQAQSLQEILQEGIIPQECRDSDTGTDCTVNHVIQALINVATIILGLLGSAALVLFVYGGFVWITAAGNSTRVEKGRNILIGTVIGIIIVLGAFTLVKFIGDSFGAPAVEEYLE